MIAQRALEGREEEKDRIYAVTAMMIGGVALARVVDDAELNERVLDSCRRMAIELLNTNG